MKIFSFERGIIAQFNTMLVLFLTQDSTLWVLKNLPPEEIEQITQDTLAMRYFLESLPASASNPNADTVREFWNSHHSNISALNLNLTEKCNLACIYCYAKGGHYNRSHGDMTPETALWGIQEAINHAVPTEPFRIEFFGGEPFLNPITIKAVIDWQKYSQTWQTTIAGKYNRISTNLTVCDELHQTLVQQGKMIVSVSLDGTASVQNEQRPFKDGRGSFETIINNLRKLRETCPENVIVARITVYKHDELLTEMVRELAATDIFDYVSIYPAAIFSQKIAPEAFSHFSDHFKKGFLRIASEYPTLLKTGRFKGCLEINRFCEEILLGRVALNHCRAGAGYFTLSPDRSVHPCHRFVGDSSWNLKDFNINEEFLDARLKPWKTSVDERNHCNSCYVRYLCGGGCKQQALIATGNLLGHDPHICSFSSLLLEAALTICCSLNPLLIDKLRCSFKELGALFVFCGQPTRPNRRPQRLLPSIIRFKNKDLKIYPIHLEEP